MISLLWTEVMQIIRGYNIMRQYANHHFVTVGQQNVITRCHRHTLRGREKNLWFQNGIIYLISVNIQITCAYACVYV